MDAIILFSHGSLLCGSGHALVQHAARLRNRGLAPIVELGYLNYSDPPFADSVARCAGAGASRIIVAPYFLVPGYFVETALPASVERARTAHPATEFVIAKPIGYDERLANAILASAAVAAPPERWRDDLVEAAASCRPDPRCPLFGTPGCPKQPAPPDSLGSANTQLHPRAHERAAAADSPDAAASRFADPPLVSGDVRQKAPITADDPDARGSRFAAESAALIVMAHGSPNATANADMLRIVDLVRRRDAGSAVTPAFLECNAPAIPDAIDACVASGAASVVAVPYFLHTGKHVADDLPTLIDAARARHPHVAFRMGPFLGSIPVVTDILADRVLAAAARQLRSSAGQL